MIKSLFLAITPAFIVTLLRTLNTACGMLERGVNTADGYAAMGEMQVKHHQHQLAQRHASEQSGGKVHQIPAKSS